MSKEQELESIWKWRDQQRRRHRVMTAGEYVAWCRGGDFISSSTEANAFPGGLTIDFRNPAIVGRFVDDE